ncbi:hypothetical protein PR003_g24060 [Phytophthora rubi]|uniref:Secreted protein n=1 Tax=Phytophthora rubi TaxID=129364 RepID=A0A6A3H7U5_9STRA|nr:hypothetical protein PR002_g28574 [Phytophthora rubi]KAE8969393.1 hypothetical protein PR001_g27510 [Phytophthora rubi]KAE9295272.1 hypothetical protein PR003_g24060 [Phytophthora rubi]
MENQLHLLGLSCSLSWHCYLVNACTGKIPCQALRDISPPILSLDNNRGFTTDRSSGRLCSLRVLPDSVHYSSNGSSI